MRDELLPLHPLQYRSLLEVALREDLGRGGDLTTNSLLPASVISSGAVVAREDGVVAGVEIATEVFRLVDAQVEIRCPISDGEAVRAGERILSLEGSGRSLFTAERVALNFLGRLSGIATATRTLVDRIEGTGTRVTCTRKTTPGLRALEKYAIRCGGGVNHRFGLDDAVLIKDNHLAVAGGVAPAVERARGAVGHLVKIEVEVDTLDQLREALEIGVDAVLLDNMSQRELREAVDLAGGRTILEASGGITPETVREVAATGVDLVSLGWLTHSAPALDVALDVAG